MLELLRQVNWMAVLPHTLVVVLVAVILRLIGVPLDMSVLLGAMTYLGLSVALQNFIPFHHRKGIKLLKEEDYAAARKAFESSYTYFTEKKWLDDQRAIVMLSAAKMSYKEMAMINIALCYLQEGDNENARKKYEAALEYYPTSKMAKAALAYLDNPEPEELTEEEDEIDQFESF